MPALGPWRILAAGALGRHFARAYSPALAPPQSLALRYSAGPRVAQECDLDERRLRHSRLPIASEQVRGCDGARTLIPRAEVAAISVRLTSQQPRFENGPGEQE